MPAKRYCFQNAATNFHFCQTNRSQDLYMTTSASPKFKSSTYKAARMVAKTVEEHFIQQVELAGKTTDFTITPVPSAQIIEAVIDAAFWASLRREEGKSPKISL